MRRCYAWWSFPWTLVFFIFILLHSVEGTRYMTLLCLVFLPCLFSAMLRTVEGTRYSALLRLVVLPSRFLQSFLCYAPHYGRNPLFSVVTSGGPSLAAFLCHYVEGTVSCLNGINDEINPRAEGAIIRLSMKWSLWIAHPSEKCSSSY
ncbi:uncharacterized protein EV420DRAFT_1565433 [Desarmillaria tabescens]|uniref:Uncharacterized protein n=1 Tax=Armillaria tabescens TaxID=1929756 RepID=A0AA39MWV5_ARMTA|nr:uncharacterized protein EV420DRAFT_1565433 [Desarmillaria tabescens]KAK0448999.1 hypothetical protein EV420DRAFT_1565433 [Desarmillaria tabescens]